MPDRVTNQDLAEFALALKAHRERPTNIHASGRVDEWMWKHMPAVVSELVDRRQAEESERPTVGLDEHKGVTTAANKVHELARRMAEVLDDMDEQTKAWVKVALVLREARKLGLLK